jgi:GAF domain-containing protein
MLDSLASATEAQHAWVARHEAGELVVVAAVGPQAESLVGFRAAADVGTAGMTFGSGQPNALALSHGDRRRVEGIGAALRDGPTTVLSVPCADESGTLGVLELIDKPDGRFTFDDVELASLFAPVAAAALSDDVFAKEVRNPLDPAALAGEIGRLQAERPQLYELLTEFVVALR